MLYARPGHAALAGEDRGRDGVADEREVARLLAVAVDTAIGCAVERGAEESMERHVRTLPRAVHREVRAATWPARRGWRSTGGTRCSAASLVTPYGDSGLRQRVLAHRDRRVVAVDRGARGVHELLERPSHAATRAAPASRRRCWSCRPGSRVPQLLRTPACAARWNTCVTPSSSDARSAS